MTNAVNEAERVQLRRSLGFLLMSALLPGSVQRHVGHRRVGLVAMRVYLGLVVAVLLVCMSALIAPGATLGVLLTPWVTVVAKVLLWAFFLAWVALLIDAWRLSRPMGLPRRGRLLMTGTALVLVVLLACVTNFLTGAFTAAGNLGEVLPGGGDVERKAGRYNVLLLGTDAADDRVGVRPDSINIASIDAETGRTVIFGLPRNMQGIPFPDDSPMHELYPDGFRCADNECMLNAIWTAGEEHADRFPKGANAGLEATKSAVAETLGLEINYYALVDMRGFASIIDAMGGIELDVMKRIPIGGGSSKVSGYIEPGQNVHLDGRRALWFARSRHDSSDYERMQRQKCVMSAMVAQLDPQVVATRFVELSQAGKDLLLTDVPRDQLVDLASLALKTRDHPIASVNFTPPLIPNTAKPDFAFIRKTVAEKIAAAEAADDASPASMVPSSSPSSASGSSAKPDTAAASSAASASSSNNDEAEVSPAASTSPRSDDEAYTKTQATDDLGTVCSVS